MITLTRVTMTTNCQHSVAVLELLFLTMRSAPMRNRFSCEHHLDHFDKDNHNEKLIIILMIILIIIKIMLALLIFFTTIVLSQAVSIVDYFVTGGFNCRLSSHRQFQ